MVVVLFIDVHLHFVSELAIQTPMLGRQGGTAGARAGEVRDEQREALYRTNGVSQSHSRIWSKWH